MVFVARVEVGITLTRKMYVTLIRQAPKTKKSKVCYESPKFLHTLADWFHCFESTANVRTQFADCMPWAITSGMNEVAREKQKTAERWFLNCSYASRHELHIRVSRRACILEWRWKTIVNEVLQEKKWSRMSLKRLSAELRSKEKTRSSWLCVRGSLNVRVHLRFCLCVSVRTCLCVCMSVCQSAWSCFHFQNPIAYSSTSNTFAADSILSRVNNNAVCNHLVVQLRLWSRSQGTARGTQKTWTAEDAQSK